MIPNRGNQLQAHVEHAAQLLRIPERAPEAAQDCHRRMLQEHEIGVIAEVSSAKHTVPEALYNWRANYVARTSPWSKRRQQLEEESGETALGGADAALFRELVTKIRQGPPLRLLATYSTSSGQNTLLSGRGTVQWRLNTSTCERLPR